MVQWFLGGSWSEKRANSNAVLRPERLGGYVRLDEAGGRLRDLVGTPTIDWDPMLYNIACIE